MRKLVFAVLLPLFSVATFAQQPAHKILGTWESIDGDVKLRFEIFEKDKKYFGKLLWASNIYEADGVTVKKDGNNPDKNLQSRYRKGIINITNLKYYEGEYIGGKLYNPSNGSTYRLSAKLQSEDELNFRGYVGVPDLGKTMKFKRLQ